jgi:transglutaminase-like putative cysteine protease
VADDEDRPQTARRDLLIRVGYEIAFDFSQPTAVLMMLYVHPSRAGSIRKPERLEVRPSVPVSEFVDSFGNRCGRLFAPAGRVVLRNDAVVEDSGQPDPQGWNTPQHNVQDLPDDVLLHLLASRYCEVDSELKDLAGTLFNSTPPGWARVQSICNFVFQHVRFDYMQARANRTALETFRERTGVCRDFTHLAITLCRCMNIPARYCTGYLGDIGVPPAASPMDFSAWFEAFLGGTWWAFDPRNHVPRIGRILMARGRDAADAALTTTFGMNQLQTFKVWTDEVADAR